MVPCWHFPWVMERQGVTYAQEFRGLVVGLGGKYRLGDYLRERPGRVGMTRCVWQVLEEEKALVQ